MLEQSNQLIIILGLLAFTVNIIVELTKDLKYIKDVPTKLYTILISLIINISYLIISKIQINISNILVALIGAFFVAFISIYGWETFDDLKDRFEKGSDD